MDKSVAFFTVCGGGEDYEFLLGSIERHASLANHLVLDTTPADRAKTFKGLPSSVVWVHDDRWGSGWENFRFVDALNAAYNNAMARFNPAALVQLDCDDFYDTDVKELFPLAKSSVVELQYVHWLWDRKPYLYGESEWHKRMWPANQGVSIERDPGWQISRLYDGNPDTHPMVRVPGGVQVNRINGLYRHHTHFALGEKAKDDRIARTSITGWPHGKTLVKDVKWPPLLARWGDEGRLPSRNYT